jgi:hypothetical protein
MKKEIKKGEKYLCFIDYLMTDGSIAFKKTQTYESLQDGSLKSELGQYHSMKVDINFQTYFELVLPIKSTNETKHYDNTKGSIYKFCEDQELNSYEFDLIKRIVRCRKKGNFLEDLEKTKFLIDLYIIETKP